ncbi:MAG TPA: RNA polymerase sigma factor RpoD/SigA [Candidatus Limnocylindrales bacterium]|nr:RNA polymerase sigma factor RpoD/SigA [Candidatus Limnocylindrales bacterium]
MLKRYLQEIGNIPLTTREEEKKLAEEIKKGNQQALNRLVEGNLRFVVKVAQDYMGYGLSFADLITEGNLGLIEAAKRFDPSRGVKFVSYGVWWIRQSILRGLSEQSRTIRLPIKQGDLLAKLNRIYHEYIQEKGGQEPSLEDLADRLGMKEEQLRQILEVAREPLSLDAPMMEDDNATLLNIISSKNNLGPEETLVNLTLIEELDKLLNEMNPREALILRLRYGIGEEGPMTLEQIGKRLNLSRERIRQIEQQAKAKLKKRACAKSLGDYLN